MGEAMQHDSRSKDDLSLQARVAIVTGGARGIGRTIARTFIGHGARVVIADILDQEGAATAEELGRGVSYLHCDISVAEQVRAMVRRVVEDHDRIDILVNNAAYHPADAAERTTADRYSDAVFMKSIDVDINGTYYCSKYVAQHMIERGSGSIVNIASIAGVVPLRNQIGHVVGKAGVVKLTEAMALELGPMGVRINTVSPGSTVTAGTRALFYGEKAAFSEMAERLVSFIPAGRPAETEDIANAALFLASDLSAYITGHNLVVDGGWTCGFTRDF